MMTVAAAAAAAGRVHGDGIHGNGLVGKT